MLIHPAVVLSVYAATVDYRERVPTRYRLLGLIWVWVFTRDVIAAQRTGLHALNKRQTS